MGIALVKQTKYASIAAMITTACALFALPGMAFAATNVTVNYTNEDSVARSVVIDLDLMSIDTDTYGYMYQRNDLNAVIKADKSVTLDAVVEAAKAQAGDEDDYTVWMPGKVMTFTTDGGHVYPGFSPFSYDLLSAPGYFYPGTHSTGMPLGNAKDAPTVLALQSGSQAMNANNPTQTAQDVLNNITTSTSKSPRLLWGWANANPANNMLGGNRYPSNIDSITISQL